MLKSKKFSLPSPALCVALVALLAAFAGTAYAGSKAAKNTVVSKSVKNNTLKSQDLKNGGVKSLDVADNSLSGADVANDSLTGTDIDESTLSLSAQGPEGVAGGDLTGTFPNPEIAQNAVGEAEIGLNAVGSFEIISSAVGSLELAPNSVTGAKVLNGSITGDDVNDGSIASADITNNSVAALDVLNESLTGADIDDESLTGADVDNGSLAGADVQDGSIASADVQDNSIASGDVANDSLTATDINESTLPFSRAGRDSTVGEFTTDADIATKTIEIPAGGGMVWVTASAQLESGAGDTGGALIECRLDINENDITATERLISIDEENQAQCATNWAQSIGPGNQTFNLEVTSLDPNESAANPVLQVMFVPFNELGN